MSRVRVSATVDADRLATARQLTGARDSALLDRALAALVEQVQGEREAAALAAQPYDTDPDLVWTVPPGPDLPYDGDVPPDVLREVEARRRRAS